MSLGLLATPTVTICKVAKMVFNVAPGNFYLSQYLEYQEENGTSATVAAMANLAGGTDAAFITTVLTNLGLAGDAGAQAFLESSIAANGRGGALEAAITALNNVSATDATYGTVKSTFDTAIVTSVSYSTNTANTSTDTTVLAAAVDAAAVAAAALPDTLNLTFTTSVDTLDGGAGGDVFTADNTGTANQMTSADTIAGKGGADTLNVFSDGNGDPLPIMTSVETINVYDNDDTFDVTGAADVTTVNAIRGDGTAVIKVDNGETVNLQDTTLSSTNSAADITVNYGATATAVTLGIDGIKAGTTPADDDVTLVGAKIEDVTINVTNAKSTIQSIDVVGAKTVTVNAGVDLVTKGSIATSAASAGTLTINGAGAVNVGTLDVGFDTVNASGNSGGLTAAIGAATDTVLTGSSGDDTITASTTNSIGSSEKLAVNAGDGTDTLVVAATADLDTAGDAARYTNFEKVSTVDSLNLALLDMTEVIFAGGGSKALTGLSATEAANVTLTADATTAFTVALAAATGKSDVLNLDLASATAATNVSIAGGVFTGFETVNIDATTGTAATDSTVVFATAGDTTAINVTGTADVVTTLTSTSSKGVTVTSTTTGDFTATGNVSKGSVITSGAGADALTLSTTLGSTYNSGGGKDTITTALAGLVADGVDDHVVNGGDSTDTLTIAINGSDIAMTDNHFTGVSNMEKLTFLENADNLSLETGGGFAAAFASGITITAAAMPDAKTFTYNGGLYQQDTTIALTSAALGNGAGEDITITTGAGSDDVTVTTDSWVGAAGAGGTITIGTRAGDDKITVTAGQLLANTTDEFAVITAGTGADTITMDTTRNGDGATAKATFVIVDGDSLEASRDKITGFEIGDGTNYSDILDFDTGAVGTLSTSTDFGVILSHSITNGVALFDDAASYAAELIINSGNLADVLGYLEANANTNGVVAFEYDSVGDGANDATMVFHNDTNNSLVELVGLTGATSVATTAVTNLMIGIGA